MPRVLDNIITVAAPDPATHTVALTWANGGTTVSSFHHQVGKGVFAALTDPAFFAQARVGEGGRSLEWPGRTRLLRRCIVVQGAPRRRA
jgi:Protein of unknown function (DUF2442)